MNLCKVIFTLSMIPILAIAGLTVDNVEEENSLEYIADRIPIKDEIEMEDEELVMAHVDMDIRDFEDLEKTIEILQKLIRKHASNNVVNQTTLNEASQVLEDLYLTEVHPALIDLKLVKKELVAVKHNLQSITLEKINEIVERAEQFLSSAYSTVREIQHEDQEWNLEEEQKKIKESFLPETNFSKPLIQKIYINESHDEMKYPVQANQGLKVSLENAKAVLKKIKEEKANRHKPEVEAPIHQSQAEVDTHKEEEVHSNIAEIETEEFLRQLKIQLEEEAARRILELQNAKANQVQGHSVLVLSNKTLEAFETAKNQAHEFLNQVLYNKEDSNIRILGTTASLKERYLDFLLMMGLVLVMAFILCLLRPVKRMMRSRARRVGELPQYNDCTAPAAGDNNAAGWERWSPWSERRKYLQKQK